MKFNKALVAAAIAGVMTATTAVAQDMTFFRIGTGGAGGTYFPIGGIIANAISNPPGSRACDKGGNCGVPGLVAMAQSTNASAHNVNAIQAGQMEAGLSGAATLHFAYNGTAKFEGNAKPDLRIIANLYPEDLHLVLPKGGSLASLADLKGKRVGIAQAGSGTQIENFGDLPEEDCVGGVRQRCFLQINTAFIRLAVFLGQAQFFGFCGFLRFWGSAGFGVCCCFCGFLRFWFLRISAFLVSKGVWFLRVFCVFGFCGFLRFWFLRISACFAF